ncbi:hypothetical protein PR048_002722 [Dryococelus australis]|uniref:Uncharacterized protein n=1 Tax=Dryococelus australis TaxID=614101 RepID=A0ABQ9IL01_9NEOP|nr:hypothetical protein PR048_002722 [Dryococelus australis]
MEQRLNGWVGATAVDPRENPPTSGIARRDSHVRNSRGDSTGNRTRFALVERSSLAEPRRANVQAKQSGTRESTWKIMRVPMTRVVRTPFDDHVVSRLQQSSLVVTSNPSCKWTQKINDVQCVADVGEVNM